MDPPVPGFSGYCGSSSSTGVGMMMNRLVPQAAQQQQTIAITVTGLAELAHSEYQVIDTA